MENRLKERLTGAAILVALIVLLVPEMFHGQRSDTAAPASSGDGPPMRSYTIDLSNSPASTAPLQSTPSAAGADGSAEPAATAPAAAPAAPQVAPAPAPSRPSSSSPAAPVAATTTAAAPKPAAVSTKPPAAGATVASAGHATSGGWSVQLGLFAQHDNAERMVHSAQAKGFSASVSDKDGKGLYHVQVGSLSDRAAAQAMQGRLRDQGFAAAVVPPH
jgi:DedD protein